MPRAKIVISLTEGAVREVAWQASSTAPFDEIAASFENDFLSSDEFMSLNIASTKYQVGRKIILRKSLISSIDITEFLD